MNNHEPAFPALTNAVGDSFAENRMDAQTRLFSTVVHSPGMTLRAYFAGDALKGFTSNPAVFASNSRTGWGLVNATDQDLASYCCHLADALLAELAKSIP